MKILIVEDELELREIIVEALKRQKYLVESVGTYRDAIDAISYYDYDCILLDLMLPDGNGLDVLREIKNSPDPLRHGGVIIISAKGAIDDRVEGLNIGADDYLSKPFHIAELTARVNSVIRRNRNMGQLAFIAGNIAIYPDKQQVLIDGEVVELSRKEYSILSHFVQKAGHVISKESLAEAVWGEYADRCDNFEFVYAQLKNLRRKLLQAGASVEIKSIYGFGYKLT